MVTETLLCECGIFICGKSKQNADGNLKQHQKSEKHRNQLARKNVNKIVFGKDIITINSYSGDYSVPEFYQGEKFEELREQIAIINYEKNDNEEEEEQKK